MGLQSRRIPVKFAARLRGSFRVRTEAEKRAISGLRTAPGGEATMREIEKEAL